MVNFSRQALNILTREKGFLFDRTCVEGYRRSVWISICCGVDGTRILHDTEYFSNRSLLVPIVPCTFNLPPLPSPPLYPCISAQPYPPVLSFFLVTRFIFFLPFPFFFFSLFFARYTSLLLAGLNGLEIEKERGRGREREKGEHNERNVFQRQGRMIDR